MKTYHAMDPSADVIDYDDGVVHLSSPRGSVDYEKVQNEVLAGEAQILPYVEPTLPAVDDIPLTLEDRVKLLEGETAIPPAKIRAEKQAKRDQGRG